MNRGEELLTVLRGISSNHVAQALNSLTPGIDWRGCSKTSIALDFNDDNHYRRLERVDLQQLRRRALARQNKQPDWYTLP